MASTTTDASGGDVNTAVLDWRGDRFHGVIAELKEQLEFGTLEEFASLVAASLQLWRAQKRRGVWVKVPKVHARYLPVLLDAGFEFHHAEPGYVMVTHWLPDEAVDSNKLPANASHYVGVGGLVINDKNEVLVITERYSFDSLQRWKLPGGLVDAGETIGDAAVREVKEETGILTEFQSVAVFRHNTRYAFGKSDLYFVARLRPLTTEISIDPEEISAARWMPVEEFVLDTRPYQLNRKLVKAATHAEAEDLALHPHVEPSFGVKFEMYMHPAVLAAVKELPITTKHQPMAGTEYSKVNAAVAASHSHDTPTATATAATPSKGVSTPTVEAAAPAPGSAATAETAAAEPATAKL